MGKIKLTEEEKKIRSRFYSKRWRDNNKEVLSNINKKYYYKDIIKHRRRNVVNRLKKKGITDNDSILEYMYTKETLKYLLTSEEKKRICGILFRRNNPEYWSKWYSENREKEIERCRINRKKKNENKPQIKKEKVEKVKDIIKEDKVEKNVSKIKNLIQKEKKPKLTYKEKRKIKLDKENRYYYDNDTTFKDYVLNIIKEMENK